MRRLSSKDRAIQHTQVLLETLFGAPIGTGRPNPAENHPASTLDHKAHRQLCGFMRINHTGEICAQALYQGQAIMARDRRIADSLKQAAEEENDHLRWTREALTGLNTHASYLNPFWYGGALTIGVAAGLCGDRWNLGFLGETETQVTAHLSDHLNQLPAEEQHYRAILMQMKMDEQAHATHAYHIGGQTLPAPVRWIMKGSAQIMKRIVYWI